MNKFDVKRMRIRFTFRVSSIFGGEYGTFVGAG